MHSRVTFTIALALLAEIVGHAFAGEATPHRDYPIIPVHFTAVEFTDGFWSRRLEVNRTVSIPHNFRMSEETGRINNFVYAAGIKEGKYVGYQFNDSDVFKAIEAACYSLVAHPDRGLERYLDSVITFIAAAQEPDGYLYTPRRLIRPDYAPPGGKDRWVGIKDGSHELYNVGHMYEAAVAHYQATGKRNLLDVAIKNADLICSTFAPGGRTEVPGHQEIEIGLCKLYRITGDTKYLAMAKRFLDQRGKRDGRELMGEYAQDHLPVVEQHEAVGHSVRAAYMYCGMADVVALTGDTTYLSSLDRIWRDVVSKKIYVTGGIGASGSNEGFSHPYTLPNQSAYCETCASIAMMLWSERMFLLHGDAQYVDVLERTLYNSFLSGVSMKGDAFFYPNPLECFYGAERSAWFGCACCPPNVARFIPNLGSYAYAHRGNDIFVSLFAAGRAVVPTDLGTVGITQETRYPWDGTVTLRVDPEKSGEFTLYLRIPGWAQDRPVPGDLYSVLQPSRGEIALTVNGSPVPLSLEKGFARVHRSWKKADRVTLNLPMPVQRIVAHSALQQNRARVALERGPIMYCLEGPDAPDGRVLSLVLPDSVTFSTEYRADLLNGVQVLHTRGIPAHRRLDGSIATGGTREVTAIPYYAWAHRGKSEMTLWPARDLSAARPTPAPTLAWRSAATASRNLQADAVRDQLDPAASNDESIPFIRWWPRKVTTEWVQYDFPSAERVSRTDVYWFDDTGTGECRLPQSWRVMYKEGSNWKPVAPAAPYPSARDRYNTVTFEPVKTTALRLEFEPVPEFSAGLMEWKIE